MATATPVYIEEKTVLRGIPYRTYVSLRAPQDNNHLRMEYLNGTLTIMSPAYAHDFSSQRVGLLIRLVASVFDIPLSGAGSTTLHRRGEGVRKGAGKEPDTSFYFANWPLIRNNTEINLDVDPPPDLAVEVDNSRNSRRKLVIYAYLRVPEVWRFDVRKGTLWFGALQADGTYTTIERSISLPMLRPALVLDLLGRCRGFDETNCLNEVTAWLRDVLLPSYRANEGA